MGTWKFFGRFQRKWGKGNQWGHILSIDNSRRIGRIRAWMDRFACAGPTVVSLSSTGATAENASSAPTTFGAAFACCPNSPGGDHGGWTLSEVVGRIAGLKCPAAGLGVKRIKERRTRDPAY